MDQDETQQGLDVDGSSEQPQSPSSSTRQARTSGIRARLGLKTRRSSTSGLGAASSSQWNDDDQADTDANPLSPVVASNANRSPYGQSNDAEAPPRHRRSVSWASRHMRTPSSASQSGLNSKQQQQQPTTSARQQNSATPAPSNKLASRQQAMVAAESENPLTRQLPYIFRFFALAGLAASIVARYIHIIPAFILAAILAHVLRAQLQTAAIDASWEKTDQLQAIANAASDDGDLNTESVEWMNAIVRTVWPLITQDYFVPFVDLLEDALMQQVPGIVHSCRVEDLDQGNVPLRVQSFTLLDSGEEAFSATQPQVHDEANTKPGAPVSSNESNGEGPVDVGDHINLEVTFAYRSPSSRKQKTKSNEASGIMTEKERASFNSAEQSAGASDNLIDQIHMLIYMAIGLQKIAAIEVPVWCEVLGIEGKMRLRIQLVPTAPFVGHVAFAFVGMPKLEMSAKPLGRRMVIDAMHLPLISSYVLHSVEAVVQGFIMPKSYTMDVASLIDARDGPRNVYALGVIVLVIHQGIDLPAADTNGNSDPFVSVSFARAGKPLFTSRVLLRTRNPVWHEMAILMVTPDDVRNHEKLRMTVFDADRFSVDDPLGKVDVSVDKLIKRALSHANDPEEPSLFETQTEKLQPMQRGKNVEGKLRYSVGFFRLSKPSQSERQASKQQMLRDAAARHAVDSPLLEDAKGEADSKSSPPIESDAVSGKDKTSHDDLMALATPFDRFIHSVGLPLDEEVLRRRKERKERVQRLRGMMEGEALATMGPPDPVWPSGILAFHIHSIDSLGFEPPQRSYTNSKRLGQKPRYTADDDALGEGSSKMPNSYVQVLINDEAVFRSRTKTLNPRPYINAGTERFVMDLKHARIDFVVRDARQRESDPILGVVGLNLDEVLASECRTTQWYTLSGGLGFGKIRITLLWRSTEVNVPRPLRGWNVGVLEIASCFVGGLSSTAYKASFEKRDARLLFETVGGRGQTDGAEPRDEYDSGEGEQATFGLHWPLKTPVRIAVRQRYPNFLYIHLHMESRVPGRVHKFAHAVIPLIQFVDNKETKKTIPLYEAGSDEWQGFEQEVMRDLSTGDGQVSADDRESRLLPVLDNLCKGRKNTEAQEDNEKDESHRRVGWLELSLVFHAGLAPEHKALMAGDHEMKVAYESWITLVDGGQRPKPKMLSAARRRKLSNAGAAYAGARAADDTTAATALDETGDGGGSSGSKDSRRGSASAVARSDAKEKLKVDTAAAGAAQGLRAEGSGESDTESEEDMDSLAWAESDRTGSGMGEPNEGVEDEDEDEDEDGLVDAEGPEGRRARIRTMHRQHRGAAQIKSYRTMEWLKTNAEDGLGRMRQKASRQQRKRLAKMESEGVSHF